MYHDNQHRPRHEAGGSLQTKMQGLLFRGSTGAALCHVQDAPEAQADGDEKERTQHLDPH
jgi:hypothetical protein